MPSLLGFTARHMQVDGDMNRFQMHSDKGHKSGTKEHDGAERNPIQHGYIYI